MSALDPVTESMFLSPLRTEKIGAQRWLLIDDLIYQSVFLNGIVIAPRGFQTDLASIPRFATWLFPKVDLYDAAAVIHDAAYGNALLTEKHERMFLIKRLGDGLFPEAARACGVSDRRAAFMHQIVSTFGNPDGHPLAFNKPLIA